MLPRPDLTLLDLNMPRMDGREISAQIRQDEKLKTIPIAILTTSESETDIAKSYQLHVNCYLCKPVLLAVLYPVPGYFPSAPSRLLSASRMSRISNFDWTDWACAFKVVLGETGVREATRCDLWKSCFVRILARLVEASSGW